MYGKSRTPAHLKTLCSTMSTPEGFAVLVSPMSSHEILLLFPTDLYIPSPPVYMMMPFANSDYLSQRIRPIVRFANLTSLTQPSGLALKICLPSGRRVCVPLVVTGILSDCTNFYRFSAGGRSRCKGLRLTKLPCIWEARSDQPGVPAFENLSTAKAVSFFVVQ